MKKMLLCLLFLVNNLLLGTLDGQDQSKEYLDKYNYYSVFVDDFEYTNGFTHSVIHSYFISELYSIDLDEDNKVLNDSIFNKNFSIIVSESLLNKNSEFHEYIKQNYDLFKKVVEDKDEDKSRHSFIVCIPRLANRSKKKALADNGFDLNLKEYTIPYIYTFMKFTFLMHDAKKDDLLNLFDKTYQKPKIFHFVGHGTNERISYFKIEEFLKLLLGLSFLNLKALAITSCFVGGLNSEKLRRDLNKLKLHDPFYLIIRGILESPAGRFGYIDPRINLFPSRRDRFFFEKTANILNNIKVLEKKQSFKKKDRDVFVDQRLLSALNPFVIESKILKDIGLKYNKNGNDNGIFNLNSFDNFIKKEKNLTYEFAAIPKLFNTRSGRWILPKKIYDILIVQNRFPDSKIVVDPQFNNLVIFNAELTKSIFLKTDDLSNFGKIVLISNKKKIDIEKVSSLGKHGEEIQITKLKLDSFFDTEINVGKVIKIGDYTLSKMNAKALASYLHLQAQSSYGTFLFVKNKDGKLVVDFKNIDLAYLSKRFLQPESKSLKEIIKKEALEFLRTKKDNKDLWFKVVQVLALTLDLPISFLAEDPTNLAYIEWSFEFYEKFFKEKIPLWVIGKLIKDLLLSKNKNVNKFLFKIIGRFFPNRYSDAFREFYSDWMTVSDDDKKNLKKALMTAIRFGYRDVVEVLLNIIGMDNINFKADNGFTPLLSAVRNRNKNIIYLLLINGADVTDSVLNMASGDLKILLNQWKAVVSNPGILNKEHNNEKALKISLKNGYSLLSIRLLEKGASINDSLLKEYKESINKILSLCIKNRDINTIVFLIKKGFKLDLRLFPSVSDKDFFKKLLLFISENNDEYFYSTLEQIGLLSGKDEVANDFLLKIIDMFFLRRQMDVVAKLIIHLKKLRILPELLDKVSDVFRGFYSRWETVLDKGKEGFQFKKTLIRAIDFGYRDVVEVLLNIIGRKNINFKADDGSSPLLHAVRTGNKNIINLLLVNGADVTDSVLATASDNLKIFLSKWKNYFNDYKEPDILNMAIKKDDLDIVKVILKKHSLVDKNILKFAPKNIKSFLTRWNTVWPRGILNKDLENEEILRRSLLHGYSLISILLLEKGIPINNILLKRYKKSINKILSLCITNKDINTIVFLLRNGFKLDLSLFPSDSDKDFLKKLLLFTSENKDEYLLKILVKLVKNDDYFVRILRQISEAKRQMSVSQIAYYHSLDYFAKNNKVDSAMILIQKNIDVPIKKDLFEHYPDYFIKVLKKAFDSH